jgi:hypothetical protein
MEKTEKIQATVTKTAVASESFPNGMVLSSEVLSLASISDEHALE